MSKTIQLAKEQKMRKMADLLSPVRIGEGEKATLQTVFGEEPFVYKTLRDLMFGFELDQEQLNIVASFKIIKPLLRKIFIPYLDKSIEVGQNYDLWQTQDIKTANQDNFEVTYEAKIKLLEMLETAFKRMEDPSLPGVSLTVEKSLPNLIARNSFISYVDSQIRFLVQFVNMDSVTAEERLKMFQTNSAK